MWNDILMNKTQPFYVWVSYLLSSYWAHPHIRDTCLSNLFS